MNPLQPSAVHWHNFYDDDRSCSSDTSYYSYKSVEEKSEEEDLEAEKGIEQVLKFDLNQADLPIPRSSLVKILAFVEDNKEKIINGTVGKNANSRNDTRLIKKDIYNLLEHDLTVIPEKGRVAVKLNGIMRGKYKVVKKEFVLNDSMIVAVAKQRIDESDNDNYEILKREDVEHEIKIMEALKDNEYVIQMLETKIYTGKIHTTTRDLTKINSLAQMISMPFCNLGDASRHLGTFSGMLFIRILSQTLYGASKIHEAGVLLRDIKPANILLEAKDGTIHIKFADFGLSCFKENDPSINDFAGSPLYTAPEFQQKYYERRTTPRYDEKGDSWSLGVTLSEIRDKALPFSKVPKNIPELEKEFELLSKKRWANDKDMICIDFAIFRLLRPNPKNRFLPGESLRIVDTVINRAENPKP